MSEIQKKPTPSSNDPIIHVWNVKMFREILERVPDHAIILFQHQKGSTVSVCHGPMGLILTDLEPCTDSDTGCQHATTVIISLMGNFLTVPNNHTRDVTKKKMNAIPASIIDKERKEPFSFSYAYDKDGELQMYVSEETASKMK